MSTFTPGAGPVDNSRSPQSLLRTLPLQSARINGGFWGGQQQTNRTISIPHGYAMLEATHALRNLRIAGGQETGEFAGFWFADSDVHKWLEAAAWELGRAADAGLQAMVDTAIMLIEGAQQPDGYLDSYFQIAKPEARWTDLDHGHELYCAGHLIQAAVAFQRAVGDERLMRVALRLVDHIFDLFGPGKRDETCGHPEIEMALVELYRTTQERRYLDLAQYFIDRRGRNKMRGHAGYGAIYQQDHVPVRDATEVAGHAVRQIYLTTGATDLYMETGEQALIDAMHRLWADMTETKMYITGGLGSRFDGESFGGPYELPSDTCYCETCAAIASLMWNWRLLLLTGDSKYADLFERTLYNGVLPSPGMDGASYLYVNPLQVRGGRYVRSGPEGEGGDEPMRPAWHSCACCPPNVMRLYASLQHYLATTRDNAIQLHQYADADLRIALPVGEVALTMQSDLPWRGNVSVRVGACPAAPWSLALRVPSWAVVAVVTINGEEVVTQRDSTGYITVERPWEAGDELTLDMTGFVGWKAPNPQVDAVRGCVALESGPLVYCFESHDQPTDVDLGTVQVDTLEPFTFIPLQTLEGGVGIGVGGVMRDAVWDGGLYRTLHGDAGDADVHKVPLTAIPYFAWGNRGMRSMRVWVPAAANSEHD